MLNIAKVKLLRTLSEIALISSLISGSFLLAYFFHIKAFPQGSIEQYSLSFIEFNIVLIVELILLITPIVLTLYYAGLVLSSTGVAKVLFREKASLVTKMVERGETDSRHIRLNFRIMATYMFFPILYFIAVLIVVRINLDRLTYVFANLTILLSNIGIYAVIGNAFKKIRCKRWFIWISILTLPFVTGLLLFINSMYIYHFCHQSAVHYFHSDYIFLSIIFLWVTVISSVGLVNPFKAKGSLINLRIGVAALSLLVIFFQFDLFYSLSADDLSFIGQNHIPLVKFHPFHWNQNLQED